MPATSFTATIDGHERKALQHASRITTMYQSPYFNMTLMPVNPDDALELTISVLDTINGPGKLTPKMWS